VTRRGSDAPRTRRCIVEGESRDPSALIRFVLAPDGSLVADLAGDLPGRGAWVTASRSAIDAAVRKGAFGRALRAPVSAPPDLADRLDRLLARRCLELLGLARRAGLVVTGFERVAERLASGGVAALIESADAAPDGRRRLSGRARGLPVVALFGREELGLALGRESVVHAALTAGGLADRFLHEAGRLAGIRTSGPDSGRSAA
jgi:predicted RNA-binding protein YlxR (DUF448 family)